MLSVASRAFTLVNAIAQSTPHRAASTAAESAVDLVKQIGGGTLKLHEAGGEGESKGIVVMLGWMGSQHSQLAKYASLYHHRGYDVLAAAPRPQHVMVPSATEGLVHSIAAAANAIAPARPVVTHAFSVGGFLYASMLQASALARGSYPGIDEPAYVAAAGAVERQASMGPQGTPPPFLGDSNPTVMGVEHKGLADLLGRQVGFIADSPVDYFGVPDGLAFAMVGRALPAAQPLLSATIAGALATFASVRSVHLACSHRFLFDPAGCPSTLLFSAGDTVSAVQPIEEVHAAWEGAGVESRLHHFDNSPHVLHMRTHPEQYAHEVGELLDRAEAWGAAR